MKRSDLPPEVETVLIEPRRLAARVAELGAEITADYASRPPVLVTVLRGGVFFLADLCRQIDLPVQLDFMAVSAYEHGRPGFVRITKDLDSPIEGAPVLVVEDIVDTGLTLNYLLQVLRQRQPASLEVCTLLDKDVRRIVDLPLAYRGFRVPDRFLVGYGLDIGGRLRQLPYIGTVTEGALYA